MARLIVANPGEPPAKWLLNILQGGTCKLCMEDKMIGELQVDHKLEVAEGGGGCSIMNLQNLCKRCHALKTGKFNSNRFRKPKPIQPTLF